MAATDSRPRILLVEDDAATRLLMTRVLEKAGYIVSAVGDGAEGFAHAARNPPDLVIIDIMMPGMDGWTLLRSLRATPELALVPAVMLTGLERPEDRIRGFQLGADDYLPKTLALTEVEARVARAIERARQLRAEVTSISKPGPSSGLQGDLTQVGLPSLLTIFDMEKKTGMLVVHGDGGKAVVLLREGRIVSIRLDQHESVSPEDAVHRVLTWKRGWFEFTAQAVDGADEVGASTAHLLMTAAQMTDEAGAIVDHLV